MGKAAKAHRAKVAKRNANVKVQEKRMQKVWQEAFEEQMNVMKEKFASMSGETMSGLTGLVESETNKDDKELENEMKNLFSHEKSQKITEDIIEELKNEIDFKDPSLFGDLFNNEMIDEIFSNDELTKNDIDELVGLIYENTDIKNNEDKKKLDTSINEMRKQFDNIILDEKTTEDSNEPTEPISGE
jgi:hypothetical protein